MAKKFLVLSVPKAEIAEKRADWIAQLVDLIKVTEHSEAVRQYPAVTLVSKEPDRDYWSTETSYRRPTNETGFDTYGIDCGGFTADGAFILSFDVPDSIVLVATEDQDAFVEVCASINIEAELVQVPAEA